MLWTRILRLGSRGSIFWKAWMVRVAISLTSPPDHRLYDHSSTRPANHSSGFSFASFEPSALSASSASNVSSAYFASSLQPARTCSRSTVQPRLTHSSIRSLNHYRASITLNRSTMAQLLPRGINRPPKEDQALRKRLTVIEHQPRTRNTGEID